MKKTFVNLAAVILITSTSFIACFDKKPKPTDNPDGADSIQKVDTIEAVENNDTATPVTASEEVKTGETQTKEATPAEGNKKEEVKAEAAKSTETPVK